MKKKAKKKYKCNGKMCFYRGKSCSAKHPVHSLVCTLKKGHKGKHIACGSITHNIAIWGDKKQK